MSYEHDGAHSPSEQDPYYILASAPLADECTRVLKHGDTFAVFDQHGDIRPVGLREQGIYHADTRFLSCFLLKLGKERPLFLSSTIKQDNDLLAVDLTNGDIPLPDGKVIPRGTLHFSRIKFLWEGGCYERLRIRNYGLFGVEVAFDLHFEADFLDIFEVRGTRRKARGQQLDVSLADDQVVLAYQGLDGVLRRTRLIFTPRPETLSATGARFRVTLQPKEEQLLYLTVVCEVKHSTRAPTFDEALTAASKTLQNMRAQSCTIQTSSEQFNDWVNRAVADLYMMTTQTSVGPYPYAGVPWFSTPFGRDGLLTALECLWVNPGLARGVLAYLASSQAREPIPERDAEPGKILHETRRGEMAALAEVPFGQYYGTVDATPLFVMLVGAYYERTADRQFLESIWPHVQAALSWIDTYGDLDGDGFVEYLRHSLTGLENQGWKDSHDSIFHADGSLAQGPIALCEVQSYVYGAKRAAAELAELLGHSGYAEELFAQAQRLRERFEETFWSEELGTYVLALDGAKRPCRVRTSNAGYALVTGIAFPERARQVARTLLTPESFSGWGIRTVAATEARYNPMAYHNGSIWPHDNALIAWGLARYGLKDEALEIVNAMFDTSLSIDLHRLPELFCGFSRRAGEGPTHYPVACSPQSWAAAAVFLLLQACLGLHLSAPTRRIAFHYPLLPPCVKEVQIRNLRVADASADLLLIRHGHDVGINVLHREGKVEITMVK
jgi:glycogen debranching enzyme